MQTVLITGANGFIGKNLIQFLSKDNRFQVVGCVRNSNSLKESDKYKIESGIDVTDIESIRNVIKKYSPVDFVIHLASLMDFYPSDKGFIYFLINIFM
jgi:nucleoside-diphosphate-sugar epimerase